MFENKSVERKNKQLGNNLLPLNGLAVEKTSHPFRICTKSCPNAKLFRGEKHDDSS